MTQFVPHVRLTRCHSAAHAAYRRRLSSQCPRQQTVASSATKPSHIRVALSAAFSAASSSVSGCGTRSPRPSTHTVTVTPAFDPAGTCAVPVWRPPAAVHSTGALTGATVPGWAGGASLTSVAIVGRLSARCRSACSSRSACTVEPMTPTTGKAPSAAVTQKPTTAASMRSAVRTSSFRDLSSRNHWVIRAGRWLASSPMTATVVRRKDDDEGRKSLPRWTLAGHPCPGTTCKRIRQRESKRS